MDAICTEEEEEVISSWCFARFLFVRGAVGTVVVGLELFFVGDNESGVSSASYVSAMDDESSERRVFLAIVLPALLTSLIGRVRSRVIFGGWTGRVAVTVML